MYIIGNGTILVTNNNVRSNNAPANDGSRGIRIVPGFAGAASTATISYNQIYGYSHGCSLTAGGNPSPTSDIAIGIIQGNTITNFNDMGIFYNPATHNISTQIVSNNVLNNIGVGSAVPNSFEGSIVTHVFISDMASAGNLTINNNQVTVTSTNPNTKGIQLFLNHTDSMLNTQILNNRIVTGPGAGSIGVNCMVSATNQLCASIINNSVSQTTAGTSSFTFSTTGSGVINILDFTQNTGNNVNITGNVNLTTSCNP
jgi:hypothetical protein